MKDQCALLTFCHVTPKGDRLSYMVCGGGEGVYVGARKCISVLGHEPCIVYSSSFSKC